MKSILSIAAVVTALTAVAGPAKSDIVAEGFPAWTGVSEKNRVQGRMISASDLRHKITVVIEIDGANARDQLMSLGPLSGISAGLYDGLGFEKGELPRDIVMIYSIRGGGDVKSLKEAAAVVDKEKDEGLEILAKSMVPVYKDVTFPGAPDNEGKLPYMYVMGIDGLDAAYKDPYEKEREPMLKEAIATQQSKLLSLSLKWRPYYGYLTPPLKSIKLLEKTLAAGKPLKPVQKEAQKSIASKDAAIAREGQMVYDAIEQAKSDLLFRIRLEATACPYRAAYDMEQLLKYWPSERKNIADLALKFKANPEIAPLAKAFSKLMIWSDPEFQPKPADAKKIVMELTKMKKQLEVVKESKNPKFAQGATLMESEIETLMTRLQQKPSL